jgi:hypothetical protein
MLRPFLRKEQNVGLERIRQEALEEEREASDPHAAW